MNDKKRIFEALQKKQNEVGHRIGMTRRELLAHGIYSFSAAAALPTLPGLLAKTAFAADCGGGPNPFIPFMVFDMAGGAALPGNFLVGKKGGPEDYLRSYNTLGWDPKKEAGSLDKRFGLPMSARYSGLFAGMTATMSADAQARLRLGSVCHFSQLDASSNKQNTAGLVTALGSKGTLITGGLGLRSSVSGGNSDPAFPGTPLSPTPISNLTELLSAVSFGGLPLKSLTKEQIKALTQASYDLSMEQREIFKSGPQGELLFDKARCAYEKNNTSGDLADTIDPRKDPVAKTVFAINETTPPTNMIAVEAALVSNTVRKNCGPSVWTLGGCDYHDGTSATGDGLDRQMGQTIGRAVQYAHLQKSPFFFQLITDGSCAAPSGTRNWREDTNEGMSVFGYYHPSAAPKYLTDNMQIGHFNDAEGAERSTLVGSDPLKASYAIFANYCQVQGKLEEFSELTGRIFSRDELSSLLVFAEG